MLTVYRSNASQGQVHADLGADFRLADDVVWVDLLEPSREEELAVEKALGLLLPTREEMAEIEFSSRLYREDDASFITANVLYNTDAEAPMTGPITFVLGKGPMVTIRYFDPRPFHLFADRLERDPGLCLSSRGVFVQLMDAIVDRTADVLERHAAEVEDRTNEVFADRRGRDFEKVLKRLGTAQLANGRIADSLVGLGRAFAFALLDEQIERDRDAREGLRSLNRDVQSLKGHVATVANSIIFLLDAALGLIGIEQNATIKIFSVAAVGFLPPTLIASIYGMNFVHMPELKWLYGYPLAVGGMVLSAVLPLWWFKRMGWL